MAKKKPVKKKPTKRTPVKKKPVKRAPTKRKPVKKNPTKRKPTKNKPEKKERRKGKISSVIGKIPESYKVKGGKAKYKSALGESEVEYDEVKVGK